MQSIGNNALHIVIGKIPVLYLWLGGRGKFGSCMTLSDFVKENKVLHGKF